MTTKTIKIVCINFIFVIICKCSYHPYIPPSDIIHADSPSPIGKNKLSITASGGTASPAISKSVFGGNAKAMYGLTDKFEIGASCFGFYLFREEETFTDYNRFSIGTSINSKYSIHPKMLSLRGNIGFGFSDLGNYSNVDIGIITGYENDYIVPLLQLSLYYGIPFNPQRHDLSIIGSDQIGEHTYKPSNTIGVIYNFGIKLPINRWLHKENLLSLYSTIGFAQLWDKTTEVDMIKLGFAIDYSIDVIKTHSKLALQQNGYFQHQQYGGLK